RAEVRVGWFRSWPHALGRNRHQLASVALCQGEHAFDLDPLIGPHCTTISRRRDEKSERARIGDTVGDRVTKQDELTRAEALGADREPGHANLLARPGSS